MWHVSGELHNVSLRLMQRLMHFFLLQPPHPHLSWKMSYSIALFTYIMWICQWRFAFNYNVIYDFINDDVSRVLDLVNFVALIVGHSAVATEVLWSNHSDKIEQQLQKMCYALRIHCGHKLLICHLYSEIVLTLRCFEFSLHSILVLAFYQELIDAGSEILKKLDNPRQFGSGNDSTMKYLSTLQELHQLLWKTHRDIESNFERSLTVVIMKSFIDGTVMPYWIYLNSTRINTIAMQTYCTCEEFEKLLEICIPCWICTRCDRLQRKFRSLFHGVSTNRRSEKLNSALIRILTQLDQERSQFSMGGYFTINNKMLGKFLFGMTSYLIICIQFRIIYTAKSIEKDGINITLLCQNISLNY
ncbi:hypothetical protein ACLKA6_014408 [Drosophila palustris]